MQDFFKAVVKPYNGKIQPCKVCDKTPNEGDELWMQNLGDDTNKKWIISPHEECFKKLQENPELGKKQSTGGGRFTSSKFPVGDVPQIFELAETLLDSFKNKRNLSTVTTASTIDFNNSNNSTIINVEKFEPLTTAEELQAVESFFKSILTGCKP